MFNLFKGDKNLNKNNFFTILKAHVILFHDNLHIQAFESIKKIINIQNSVTCYQIAKYFKFTQLSKLALCYIESYFTVVCETNNFLELDYTLVANILTKCNLQLDSDIATIMMKDTA